jgi:ferredoxin-NADP reductase
MTISPATEGDGLVDTVTAIPAEAAPAKAPDGLIDVRVTAIRYAARDTHLFEFTPLDGKPLPRYEPGAHIDLHLPNGLVRQYSLIRPEPAPASYTVGIKRDPASRGGSRYIHDELRVGKALKISPPRNNFPLVESASQVVLFAGGIGITPIWCMVQRLEMLGRSWKLHYACRSRADMAFLTLRAAWLCGIGVTARSRSKRRVDGRAERDASPPKDAKTLLQEWAQGRGLPLPAYRETDRSGPPHAPLFRVEVTVEGLDPVDATGPSKRAAERAAAESLLLRVRPDHAC